MAESKPIIFDEYKEQIKKIMFGYKLVSDKEQKEKMEKIRSLRLPSEESRIVKDFLKNYNNLNNSSFLSDVKIHVDNEDYTDPLESLNILENNRMIYEKINNRNSRRQKSLYKKIMEAVANRPIVDLNKIKITSILPKNIILAGSKSDNSES